MPSDAPMKCQRLDAGQPCPHDAQWVPILVLRAFSGQPRNTAALARFDQLPVCDAHQRKMEPRHLITNEGWAQLKHGFLAAGKAAPKREFTTLEWSEI